MGPIVGPFINSVNSTKVDVHRDMSAFTKAVSVAAWVSTKERLEPVVKEEAIINDRDPLRPHQPTKMISAIESPSPRMLKNGLNSAMQNSLNISMYMNIKGTAA